MTLYRVSAAYQTVGASVANSNTLRVTMATAVAAIQTPAAIKVTGIYITVSRSIAGLDNPPAGSGQPLLAWDSSSLRRRYRYRSRLFLNPYPASFQIGQVKARDYDDLTLRIFGDGALLFEQTITSKAEFTLPPLPQDSTEIELEGTSQVYSVEIAEDVRELQ